MSQPKHDPVKHPAHYTAYPVQPIAFTRHLGFCLGNAAKYVLRAPLKGGAEDCDKALQYLKWERETPGDFIPDSPVEIGKILHPLILYLQEQPGAVAEHQEAFLRFLMSYVDFYHAPILSEMEKEVRALKKELKDGQQA